MEDGVALLADVAMLIAGLWLLVYRLLARTQYRNKVTFAMIVCSGSSFFLLAPLMPMDTWIGVPTLLVLGALLSATGPCMHAFLLAGVLGTYFGALIWHLGLCQAGVGGWLSEAHAMLMGFFAIVFIVAFACGGFQPLELILVPSTAALFLSISLWHLMMGLGDDSRLFEAAPCSAKLKLNAFVWLVLAMCAIVLQWRLLITPAVGNTDLVASILPGAQPAEGPDGRLDQLRANGLQGVNIINDAICAPEGTDFSHLSERDRKIVEICRKDEDQKYRVLFGGGLY